MRFAVRHRRNVAAWLAALLLLVQLVTAAYACPRIDGQPGPVGPASALMADCSGDMPSTMDPDQPQLCRAHCDQGSQSVNPQGSPEAQATAAVLPVLLWVLPLAVASPAVTALARAPVGGAPRGSPPLYLSLLSLRN